MIKTIIIDDAKIARELLISMLNELISDIEIIGEADNIQDAVVLIKKEKPDLIFLDIEMPGGLGIDIFQYFEDDDINFETIFTTAYHQYAIQAFKLSAIDYLLKPIRENELFNACLKAKNRMIEKKGNEQWQILLHNFYQETEKIISIPISNGNEFIRVLEIEYIEADGAYSHVFLKDGSKKIVSKNLKYFEEILSGFTYFSKIHRSCIVNLHEIQQYIKSDRGIVFMRIGKELSISRGCREEFLEKMEKIIG